MASSSKEPAIKKEGFPAMEEEIYILCSTYPPEKVFSQKDLFNLKVIPNNEVSTLLSCTQHLAKRGLLRLMMRDGKTHWKIVKREDAARTSTLSMEENMVYQQIESSNRAGIWIKTIRAKTNLPPAVVTRCLKVLESKKLIKPIVSAKNPGRKTYLLARLQPSDDVTGGPFFTDGKLDEEFVHQLGVWSERYIHARSWWFAPPPAKESGKRREKEKLTTEEAESLMAQEFQSKDVGRRSKKVLPMPPGYNGYPTIPEITKAVNESKVSGVIMKEADLRQLMDILCWDGKIVKVMDGKGYKAVHPQIKDDRDIENGLTESPCGRCPVFDLCEEGGPVNARTCTYFQDWLAL